MPEAVASTLEIAERTDLEMELGQLLLPRFPTPDGVEPGEMLRELAMDGLRRRYGDPIPADALERLGFELGVISDMGFESYFLIVWDFVRYAKGNGIAVGPGRGSAAGSIVAYALEITDIDPLANDLLFERFLNPGRKSMPDIDIDFSVRGRERVIRYVAEKYGRECVAQIITFGKMAPRAATRDAARVLGYDYATGDKLAKQIPEPILGRNPSFEDCLKPGEELKRTYDTDIDARRIIDTAQGLEGIVRNHSIHAAAVVIADRPLQEIVPLQLAEDRGSGNGNGNGNGKAERAYKTVTQYSMGPIEEIGLLKMDFLGLAEPRRDRGRDDDHRAVSGREDRHQGHPARRSEDLPDALPRGLRRSLPIRVRRDARRAQDRSPDGVPGPRGARRPVPAGGYALHRRLREGQARPFLGGLPRSTAAADNPVHLRLRDLPGAADGDRQADGGFLAGRGGRPPEGRRKEEARPDGDDEGQVPGGSRRLDHRPPRRPGPVVADGSGRRLLLQPLTCRLLRADRLQDRLAPRQLPGGVHGCPDLDRDVDEGQGPVLRQPLRRDGDRGAAART